MRLRGESITYKETLAVVERTSCSALLIIVCCSVVKKIINVWSHYVRKYDISVGWFFILDPIKLILLCFGCLSKYKSSTLRCQNCLVL